LADWEGVEAFLASMPDEDRRRLLRHAGLPGGEAATVADLRAYAASLGTSPATLLALAGARASAAGDAVLARAAGAAALEMARSEDERQLAHVCLARTHFRDRRERAELEAFERHCRAAVELGHAGTFCYERLAALYEYRGDLQEAARVCRLAVGVLEAAGDARSARGFRKRLRRLEEKGGG
jgi:hypothetical protein